jgi:enoyl-[acyl-carrier protein] reductase I
MIYLKDKRALVVGVANDQSIAWGIARAFRQSGADLAITYLNQKAEAYVRPLAERVNAAIVMPLDVERPEQEEPLFDEIRRVWGRLDILVHSIAFAPGDDLKGRVIDTSELGFARAMDISVHSFIRLARRAEPLMTSGGSCLAMSFYGAAKVVDTYNLMGPVKAALEAVTRELASELGQRNITVNAVSPGPIATRAAGGIAKFDQLMDEAIARSPMRRLATIDDVGAAAAFLASDLARNITGGVIYVDAGRHIMG